MVRYFLKNKIIDILSTGGKIWLYSYDLDLVCSMFYIPASNKSLKKHSIYSDESITGSLGPIMVSPDYVGNGFQIEMLKVFNKDCKDMGKKYIFTKVHVDNIYSLNNFLKDNYVVTDIYESERGMNKALVKRLD